MEFEIKESKVEGGVLALTVEVAAEAVDHAFEKVRRELSSYVRIPGFRGGKAPLGVLANHVGKERFHREIQRELLPRYYYKAVETSGSRPVSPVKYEDLKLEKGEPFRFKAVVTVAPEAEIGDYKDAKLELPEPDPVTDGDVEDRVMQLRLRFAKSKAKDGGIEKGDVCGMAVEGKVKGQVFKSLSRKMVTVRVGDNEFFPAFDSHLVGLEKGAKKEFQVDAPPDTENPNLKGGKVDFSVEIKNVRGVDLPELDEAFLKHFGNEFKTVDELKARIRQELEHEAAQEADKKLDTVMQDFLAGLVKVEAPASLVDLRTTEKLAEFKEQFRGGYGYADYLQEWSRTEEDLKGQLRERAEKEIKIELALDEVAAKEGLTASDADVTAHLKEVAKAVRRSPLDVEEMVDASGSRILRKQDLARDKAFHWLKARYSQS